MTNLTTDDLLDMSYEGLNTIARRLGFIPERFVGKYGRARLVVAIAKQMGLK